MSYRPSVHEPVTSWARHLDAVMRERKWSRVRLFEEVGPELGYSAKSRSALLPLLIDKEPDEATAAVLRRHFGDPPPETKTEKSAPVVGDALVAAAIDRQTEMLRAVLIALAGPALTPELQAWAEEMHQALSTGSRLPRIPDGGMVR